VGGRSSSLSAGVASMKKFPTLADVAQTLMLRDSSQPRLTE
jgi:hypothetical protein